MSPTTPAPLELQNVTCVFGDGPRRVVALEDVSLVLEPGELVAVMGPSARAAQLRRARIGLVFQHYNLVPTLTVGENVSLPLELDGRAPADCREAARIALQEVGLAGLADRFPEEISGGQAQRAAIARALIGERSVLLADEPTGALDTTTGDDVLRILRARVDAGAAGLIVTHEPRFAGWVDRVIVVRDGRLVDDGGELR